MTALWSDEVKSEGPSRVTWEIEQVADSCRLLLTHDQLREGANDQIYGGWPMILSGLKTWLESGRAAYHARLTHVLSRLRNEQAGGSNDWHRDPITVSALLASRSATRTRH